MWSVAVVALLVAVVITTVGVITCVLSHYRTAATSSSGGGLPPPPPPQHQSHPPPPPHHHYPFAATHTTTTVPVRIYIHHACTTLIHMLAVQSSCNMERELGAQRDRQVRLHSVHTDLELDLPPSIALPDGEEIPYGSSTRLHIRDSEQESEIYQKCIRPPPNRTVFDGESPPPYRSSSAGLLSLGSTTGSSASSSDWTTHSVVRCHSMSSKYPPPPHLPPVIVPSRQRLDCTGITPSTTAPPPLGHNPTPLSRLTMVPCLADTPHPHRPHTNSILSSSTSSSSSSSSSNCSSSSSRSST
ncbi:protein TMEPAI isoform X2 [Nilaparvata lugens]|uniref:protein TMEPAI isoform X2 n=1 Tax=Nilaparvata lugens TaxID=108931 RepID=UPI00193E6E6B|nr:protein TMEPAI isoform X2 [Nilaparvata lugens]